MIVTDSEFLVPDSAIASAALNISVMPMLISLIPFLVSADMSETWVMA